MNNELIQELRIHNDLIKLEIRQIKLNCLELVSSNNGYRLFEKDAINITEVAQVLYEWIMDED